MGDLTHEELKKQQDFRAEMIPHLDALYNFALRLTTDPTDAEDLVQDTIVKAFRFFLTAMRKVPMPKHGFSVF